MHYEVQLKQTILVPTAHLESSAKHFEFLSFFVYILLTRGCQNSWGNYCSIQVLHVGIQQSYYKKLLLHMSILPGRAVYGQQFFVLSKLFGEQTTYTWMYLPGFQKSKKGREKKAALSWGWFFLMCLESSHNAGRCLYSNLHKVLAGYSPSQCLFRCTCPQAAAVSPRMVWFNTNRVMVCDPLNRRLFISANLCPPSPSYHTSYVVWKPFRDSHHTKRNVSVAPCLISSMNFH